LYLRPHCTNFSISYGKVGLFFAERIFSSLTLEIGSDLQLKQTLILLVKLSNIFCLAKNVQLELLMLISFYFNELK